MYCIVVGDIVNSKLLEPDVRKNVNKALQKTFDRINTDYLGSLITTFGMVRGDAFEGVILAQFYAPKIVLAIIKAVYSVNKTIVRISVALGTLTVTSEDRNIADGPAFHTAFENLEELKKLGSKHWFQVHFEIGKLAQSLVTGQLALLAALTEGWTDRQREVVWEMENQNGSKKDVIKTLGLTSAVLDKHLKAANYKAYSLAWKGLKDFLINMDEHIHEGKLVTEKNYVQHFNKGLREIEEMHNLPAALLHFQAALRLALEKPGGNDSLLIPIYNKLARVLLSMEKYDDAEFFINSSLKLQEKMPKTRLHYAETLLIMAEISTGKANYLTAIEFFEKALDTAKNLLNNVHPFIGDIYNSFAGCHFAAGKHNLALACAEEARAVSSYHSCDGSAGVVR
ncbi:MAG: SatD family protein [Defluviitaleaceae bacterium]|nr:SatD family protein [Defluviitaleaceae bacterium]